MTPLELFAALACGAWLSVLTLADIALRVHATGHVGPCWGCPRG